MFISKNVVGGVLKKCCEPFVGRDQVPQIPFQQCKKYKNQLRLNKVTESLKVGTFLRQLYLVQNLVTYPYTVV